MKKIIAIGMISMFLLTGLTTISASTIKTKETIITKTFEKNKCNRDILFELRNNNYDIQGHTYSSATAGIDGRIDPIYFKIWKNDKFNYSAGDRSIILENYMYIIVDMSDVDENGFIVNNTIGILKYDITDGSLIKSVILESNYEARPIDIASYENNIYLVAECSSGIWYMDPVLIKLDLNLNPIKTSTISIDQSKYIYSRPGRMVIGDDGIYIAGDICKNTGEFDVFIAKFDANCDKIWKDYVIIDKKDDSFGAMTIDNEILYITGTSSIDIDKVAHWWPFTIKYDSNGNMIKEMTGEEYLQGSSIKVYDGKIFIAYAQCKLDNNPLGASYDILIAAYDIELNDPPLWTLHADEGILEMGTDMVICGDYLYTCGLTCDFDFEDWIIYLGGFILKSNINTGEREWYKRFNQICIPSSIHSINNNLYLSGVIRTSADEKLTFIMKCDEDGKDGDALSVDKMCISFGNVQKDKSITSKFTLQYQGSNTINWQITEYPSWLECDKLSGVLDTNNNEISVKITANTKGIQKQLYSDHIKIVSDGGNEEIELVITVTEKKEKTQSLFYLDFIEKLLNKISVYLQDHDLNLKTLNKNH